MCCILCKKGDTCCWVLPGSIFTCFLSTLTSPGRAKSGQTSSYIHNKTVFFETSEKRSWEPAVAQYLLQIVRPGARLDHFFNFLGELRIVPIPTTKKSRKSQQMNQQRKGWSNLLIHCLYFPMSSKIQTIALAWVCCKKIYPFAAASFKHACGTSQQLWGAAMTRRRRLRSSYQECLVCTRFLYYAYVTQKIDWLICNCVSILVNQLFNN